VPPVVPPVVVEEAPPVELPPVVDAPPVPVAPAVALPEVPPSAAPPDWQATSTKEPKVMTSALRMRTSRLSS
jgi:hypothetical protein